MPEDPTHSADDCRTWDSVWRNQRPRRNKTHNIVAVRYLRRHVALKGKTFCEVGGTGQVAAMLAKRCSAVTLWDTSPEALTIARETYGHLHNFSTEQRDLFDAGSIYDITFSSGLLEHFLENKRIDAFNKIVKMTREMAIVVVPSCRPGNWWRAIRHARLGTLPAWTPMSERDLWELATTCNSRLVCCTRLESTYGAIPSKSIAVHTLRTLRRIMCRLHVTSGYDTEDGGLILGVFAGAGN